MYLFRLLYFSRGPLICGRPHICIRYAIQERRLLLLGQIFYSQGRPYKRGTTVMASDLPLWRGHPSDSIPKRWPYKRGTALWLDLVHVENKSRLKCNHRDSTNQDGEHYNIACSLWHKSTYILMIFRIFFCQVWCVLCYFQISTFYAL